MWWHGHCGDIVRPSFFHFHHERITPPSLNHYHYSNPPRPRSFPTPLFFLRLRVLLDVLELSDTVLVDHTANKIGAAHDEPSLNFVNAFLQEVNALLRRHIGPVVAI